MELGFKKCYNFHINQ